MPQPPGNRPEDFAYHKGEEHLIKAMKMLIGADVSKQRIIELVEEEYETAKRQFERMVERQHAAEARRAVKEGYKDKLTEKRIELVKKHFPEFAQEKDL